MKQNQPKGKVRVDPEKHGMNKLEKQPRNEEKNWREYSS